MWGGGGGRGRGGRVDADCRTSKKQGEKEGEKIAK